MGRCHCKAAVPYADFSGTPGNVTTTALMLVVAFAGAATQVTITNPLYKRTDHVSITPVEPTLSALATVRMAWSADSVDGTLIVNRSTGSIPNQQVQIFISR